MSDQRPIGVELHAVEGPRARACAICGNATMTQLYEFRPLKLNLEICDGCLGSARAKGAAEG